MVHTFLNILLASFISFFSPQHYEIAYFRLNFDFVFLNANLESNLEITAIECMTSLKAMSDNTKRGIKCRLLP